jgi:hypothetical protein
MDRIHLLIKTAAFSFLPDEEAMRSRQSATLKNWVKLMPDLACPAP